MIYLAKINRLIIAALTHLSPYKKTKQDTVISREIRSFVHKDSHINCVYHKTHKQKKTQRHTRTDLWEPPAVTGSLDHIVFAALPVPPVCSAHRSSPRPASVRPELGTRLAGPTGSSLKRINRLLCCAYIVLVWEYLYQSGWNHTNKGNSEVTWLKGFCVTTWKDL